MWGLSPFFNPIKSSPTKTGFLLTDLANLFIHESYPKPLATIIFALVNFLASAVVGSKSCGSTLLLSIIAVAVPYFPTIFLAMSE